MKRIRTTHVRMPAYALQFLVNDDPSGLDLPDLTAIEVFMSDFTETAERLHGSVIVSPEEDAEPTFTWSPAFGPACEVIPCTITIVA